ncbi:uncharacterized protein PV09_08043 [Verruconis gallopava]|uniref:Uncharacterized protein n=1 Tax=Verruconis gallopava TaxID=253628 RepID=A0A0D2A1X4_9PEZI|nr:uncharacterized protein PV09_08043 [Verruconis gallopava]KIW00330.1 hypothetical protein PV09_08043 [Verruconis gallopava]
MSSAIYVEFEGGRRISHKDIGNDLTNAEIHDVFLEAKKFFEILMSEVQKRSLKIVDRWETILQENSERLHLMEDLSARDLKNIQFAYDVAIKSKKEQNSQNVQYKLFLDVVKRFCDHGVRLLCIISFTQSMIYKLRDNERKELHKFIRDKTKTYSSLVLDSLATKHEVSKIFGEQATSTMITLPTQFVNPHVPVWVPAIENYILLPPGNYATFAVAPYDAITLPSQLLDEGIQNSQHFLEERARKSRYTSCVFIALPEKDGDCVVIARLSYSAGFALTFNGFT